MKTRTWPTKDISVASLHLDPKNPRLGREGLAWTPREIVQHLFLHDKALVVAESITVRGYFPNEPLLAIKEDSRYVVVEGNRRLAALKALRAPDLLEGPVARQVERLSRRIEEPSALARVPVTIAPSRRATDRQVAGRHVGTPVLAWQAENRASFILAKLEEGYDNSGLGAELGFSVADIQEARQTKAIADMARALDLPTQVKAKLDNPRAKLFTTIERVVESSVGRDFLRVEPDPEYGIRGTTSLAEFVRGFRRLVTDVALGRVSSRTLNTNEDIRKYFEGWSPQERPAKKRGTFVPADVIAGKPATDRAPRPMTAERPRRPAQASRTVLPRDFKVRFGSERLVDIRTELTQLTREDHPNAGAVLLRVFLELAVVDYLQRTGEMPKIIARLKAKGDRLPFDVPAMKQLTPEIVKIAKKQLPAPEATKVEKALRYDPAAPFSISDLHAFVHSSELPGERDIRQFWLRTEPLFRLMLERAPEAMPE